MHLFCYFNFFSLYLGDDSCPWQSVDGIYWPMLVWIPGNSHFCPPDSVLHFSTWLWKLKNVNKHLHASISQSICRKCLLSSSVFKRNKNISTFFTFLSQWFFSKINETLLFYRHVRLWQQGANISPFSSWSPLLNSYPRALNWN